MQYHNYHVLSCLALWLALRRAQVLSGWPRFFSWCEFAPKIASKRAELLLLFFSAQDFHNKSSRPSVSGDRGSIRPCPIIVFSSCFHPSDIGDDSVAPPSGTYVDSFKIYGPVLLNDESPGRATVADPFPAKLSDAMDEVRNHKRHNEAAYRSSV